MIKLNPMTTTQSKKHSIDQIIEIVATLTPEEQVKLWQWLGEEINPYQQPWLKTAGIFQDDPHFEDVKHYINEYRQENARNFSKIPNLKVERFKTGEKKR